MTDKLKIEKDVTAERRAFLKKAGAVALAAPATALLLSTATASRVAADSTTGSTAP